MSDLNKKGSINLLGVFDHAAISILHSIEEGIILHQTNNIKDSGAAFEAKIRCFFEKFLPKKYDVKHGYLVNYNSICSPQIDLIFALRNRTQTLFESPDGSAYIPFTNNLMIGEIKSSASNIKSNLAQINKIITCLDKMQNTILHYGTVLQKAEVTMIFGKCSEEERDDLINLINSTEKNQATKLPDSVLLLDRGEFISRGNALSELFKGQDDRPLELDSRTSFNGSNYVLYEPCKKDRQKGAMLLWYFYYVYYRLEKHENASCSNNPFSEKIFSEYKIQIKEK